MTKHNWLKKLGVVALAVMMVLSLSAMTVFGATNPDLPDPNATGSITVHKYKTSAPSDTPGTGEEITDPSALGTPLAGVTFALYKVNDAYVQGLTEAELNAFDLSNAATLAAVKAQATLVSEEVTAADGSILWDDLAQGYYLLEETAIPADLNVEMSVPAIVSIPASYTSTGTGFNYDVHVYPKNVSNEDIEKEVTSSTGKYYDVGDVVSYKINPKIKVALRAGTEGAYTYGSFVVTDTLDERLTFTAGSSVVNAVGGTPALLTEGASGHYTVAVAADNTVTWSLTQLGMDLVSDNGNTALSIAFDTTVNSKVTEGSPAGNGSIENGAGMEFKSGDGLEEGEAEVENPAVIKLAGLVINKVDSKDATILLDGAEFKIARTLADANAGNYILNDAGDPILVVTGDDTTTTDVEKGYGIFTGLGIDQETGGEFYLVETQAPMMSHGNAKDYNKINNVIKVTIPAGVGQHIETIQNVALGDSGSGPIFVLPETGGIGTMIFVVIGVALMAGGVLLLVKNRKRGEAK